MKYLFLLIALYCTSIFAQNIDCQRINKATAFLSDKKMTARIYSSSAVADGQITNMMEVDSVKNSRMIKTMPKKIIHTPLGEKENMNRIEVIVIAGISYIKSNLNTDWTYQKMPPQDSAATKTLYDMYADTKFEDCQKLGTETIDGKSYDVVESIMRQKGIVDSTKVRIWIDFQADVIRKMEYVLGQKVGNPENARITQVSLEYGVAVSIQKPENAVPEKPAPPLDRTIPQYKEGTKGLFIFMQSNLTYPQVAKDAKKEGTVYVKFMVDVDGSVCDINVSRGIGLGCDEAAIELVKKTSGNWLPALSFNQPIRAAYTMPVRFGLK